MSSATDNLPYVSLVVTSRNDNHGGRLLDRMQTFANSFLDQCRRHQLTAELVIVEWNPPDDRPPLAEAMRWPRENSHCPVRIIRVPPRIHRRFQNADRLPLFQMIAKNVGIRRARAPFVLATNIDILFSEELVCYLASRRLRNKFMYRIDRRDVPAELPIERPVEQLLDFCRQHVIRVHGRWGSIDATTGRYYGGHRTWKTMIQDRYVQVFGAGCEKRLHTNGCGDFTLMSKDNWFAVRGYPELHMFSFNIDGLLCQIAYFAGARELVLNHPMEIYHIEHSIGSGWTPEGQEALRSRIQSAAIPHLNYEQYRSFAIRMRKDGRPLTFNDQNWGLADELLSEQTICAEMRGSSDNAGASVRTNFS